MTSSANFGIFSYLVQEVYCKDENLYPEIYIKFSFFFTYYPIPMVPTHRYLMSRFSLQVFYLWRHVLLTAPPFILWWSNLEILFPPPPPQLSLRTRAALSSNSNGTRSVYNSKNPKSSLYCEMSMTPHHKKFVFNLYIVHDQKNPDYDNFIFLESAWNSTSFDTHLPLFG
jgi:hypothetical protein